MTFFFYFISLNNFILFLPSFLCVDIAMHSLHEIRHNSYTSEGMLQALLVTVLVDASQSNTLYLWVMSLNLFQQLLSPLNANARVSCFALCGKDGTD